MQCLNTSQSNKIKTEDGHHHGSEIRTIVIGEPQKIILSPRVEVRRVVNGVPGAILERHHSIQSEDIEPKIQIITKPMPAVIHGRSSSPPGLQQVRVIKDGRFYDEHHHHSPVRHHLQSSQQQHHSNNYQSSVREEPRKYVVSRQINVISTSDQNVFRPPVVSSTTIASNNHHSNNNNINGNSTSTAMRPPPPPPPTMHKMKITNSISEEPSSSIPDLGKSIFLVIFFSQKLYLSKFFHS